MITTQPIAAYYLAKSLPLPLIEAAAGLPLLSKRRNALILGSLGSRAAVVFAFGVAVLFDFKKEDTGPFLKRLAASGFEPAASHETEEYAVRIDPDHDVAVEFDSTVLPKLTADTLYILSEVLAQSVAIEHVEKKVVDIVNRFEQVTSGLEQGGRIRSSDAEVLKTIGAGRSITQYVLSQLSLLDRPDSTWEDRDVEATFAGMRRMFELEDRFRAIEFRLDFIQGTSELVLDLIQNRRSVRLEWAIVWLFVIDIVLVLYEVSSKSS